MMKEKIIKLLRSGELELARTLAYANGIDWIGYVSDILIDSTENSLCAGPLTIASGVTLTVSGNLTVV